MLIKIKLLNGQIKELEVEPTDTVLNLKLMLEERQGIPPPQQRLVVGGRPLVDDKTLEESKIKPGSLISLLLSLKGGY